MTPVPTEDVEARPASFNVVTSLAEKRGSEDHPALPSCTSSSSSSTSSSSTGSTLTSTQSYFEDKFQQLGSIPATKRNMFLPKQGLSRSNNTSLLGERKQINNFWDLFRAFSFVLFHFSACFQQKIFSIAWDRTRDGQITEFITHGATNVCVMA